MLLLPLVEDTLEMDNASNSRTRMVVKSFLVILLTVSGGIAGYLVGSQGAKHTAPEVLLYSPIDQTEGHIERTLCRSKCFFDAISMMVDDNRRRASIPQDRKVFLLNSLGESQIGEVLPHFALGAFQDSSPEVRLACAQSLASWIGYFMQAMTIIQRTLHLEEDGRVKAAKESLVAASSVRVTEPLPPNE